MTAPRLALLGLLLTSCSGSSCLGPLATLPGPLPTTAEDQNGATLNLSTEGFAFLAQILPSLLGPSLTQGFSVTIPQTSVNTGFGTETVCEPSQCPYSDTSLCTGGCPIVATLSGLTVSTRAPNQLVISVNLTVDESDYGLSSAEACVAGGSGGACNNEIWIAGSLATCPIPLHVDAQTVSLPINLTFDPVSQSLALVPGATDVAITSSELDTSQCGIISLFIGALLPSLNTQIATLIASQLQNALDGFQCLAPGFYADAGACPDGSSVGTDHAGQPACEIPNDGGCVVKPEGLLGIADLGSALAAEGAPPAPTALEIFPGGEASASLPPLVDASSGLDLPVIDAFATVEPSSCVPPLPARTYATPAVIDFAAAAQGLGVQGYMVGVGLSQPMLQRAADQAYAGGLFCLEIGGAGSTQITTADLAGVFPQVAELFPTEPVTLSFHPQQPPVVALGAGTAAGDGGFGTPLITLTLPGLRVDATAGLDDRAVRLLSFTADLTFPLALAIAGGGSSLQVLLGPPAQFFGDIQAEASPLLGLSAAELTPQLQKFLPVAGALASTAIGNIAPISIPAISGYTPTVVAVGGIVPGADAGEFDDLGLFLNLSADGGAGASSNGFPARVAARVIDSQLPVLGDVEPGGVLSAWPTEVVALEGVGPLESSYRVDDGAFHVWQPGNPVAIADPRFLLVGPHTLDVRVRTQGDLNDGEILSLPVTIQFPTTRATPPTLTTTGDLPAASTGGTCATGLGRSGWLALGALALLRRRRR